MTATQPTPFDGEPPLTPAQCAAIVAESHTLLAAGAGSGKTTTLVDKILYALGADRVPGSASARHCELHEIAAITFTKAAAADLKHKLRTRLRKVADWHSARGDAGQSAIWRARVYEVDRARIGTVHSFCGEILRDFALRLGMDPGFAILEGAEATRLQTEGVAVALDRALSSRPASMELIETLGLAKTEKILEHLAGRPDMLIELRDSWFDESGPRVAELRALVTDQRAAWGCKESAGIWKDDLDVLSARLCGELVRLAIEVRAAVVERLDELSALDFDEMILRTRDALRNDADILRAVRRKLAWLFVDEFQDTDANQLEIANLISDFDGAVSGVSADMPSLCIVGDPKQSIYRFRRADVSLWGRVEHAFRSKGIEPIVLDTNFRSTAPIVAYVNATFSGLIGKSPDAVIDAGHDIPYIPLVEHRRPPGDSRAVELLDIASDSGERDAPNAGERRDEEAERVVARIFELVNGQNVIWDDRSGTFRAASWRDIAILVRARTPVPAFEAAFRRHRIPYYVRSLKGFFARREIMDVQLLLQALADRHDDVAWLGLLRSPFIGLTDEAILRARLANANAPISAVISEAGAGSDATLFTRTRTFIQRLRALRDRITVAELIQYAADESGYAAYLLTHPGGELAAMNLKKLIQMADGRSGDTVSDFLEFIDDSISLDAKEGDAALFTADEDVVTITTVHSAKGLEWPVVFLADLDGKLSRTDNSPILADPDAGVALSIGDEKVKPGAWDYLKQRNHELSLAEEKRVWYVAATRARDRLILCARRDDVAEAVTFKDGTAEGPAKLVKHWLLQALVATEDSHCYGDDAAYTVDVCTTPLRDAPANSMGVLPTAGDVAAARMTVDPAVTARLAPIPLTRTLPRYSATQLMTVAKDPKAYERRYVFGLPDRRIFDRGADGSHAPRGVPANVLGDVLHGSLEHERDDADLLLYIEVELSSRLGEDATSPRVQAATKRLRELVHQSRTHPSVIRLYDSEMCERELAFTWFVHSAGGSVTIGGAMDLVAFIDGRPEILDYKSHKLRQGQEQSTAAGYVVQQQVYSAACAAITGTMPSQFTFFFPETATPVNETIDVAAIEQAESCVRELIGKVPSGQA